MGRTQIIAVAGLLFMTTLAQAVDITVNQVSRLIQISEKGVTDRRDWARDLLEVLRVHDFDVSRENVCAVIAVIDQESSFRADPAVPGLGKVSESALRDKFGKIPVAGAVAMRLIETSPTPDDSYLLRIRNARTERDLDLVFRSFVEDASKRSNLSLLVNSGLLNAAIDRRNEIDTAGSMQVSVAFALAEAKSRRWLPMQLVDVYAVRDDLYTRRGGMYYGALQLLGYDSGYSKKIFRFADYNAGRYASRNAALQKIVAELSGTNLQLDGDLLVYENGAARVKPSSSELAVRAVAKRHGLGLDDQRIRLDLLEEKSAKLAENRTYRRLRELYRKLKATEPPLAIIPEIELNSPKIKRRMTTAIFATQVDKKYQACMKAGF